MKKLLAFFTIFTILISGTPTIAAGDAYNPLTIPLNSGQAKLGTVEYVVEGGGIQNSTFIAITPTNTPTGGESRVWKWCTGLDDPICDPRIGTYGLSALSVLGPCLTATQENCIDSLAIGTDSSNLADAKLIRTTGGDSFAPNPQYNYPGSSTISLWNVPGTSTNYAVTSTYHLWFQRDKFKVTDFYADVTPYREKTGPYKDYKVDTDPNVKAEDRFAKNSTPGYWSCVFAENGICGVAQDMPENTRIKLKLRLSTDVGGWFQGRIQDPILDAKPFSPTNNLITIDASNVSVPRLVYPTFKEDMPSQEKDWFSKNGTWPATSGQGTGPQAGHPQDSFPFIAYFRDKVKDTASAVNHFWNVTTTSYGNGSQCLQDKSKVLGIVTTNAMAYDGTSPSFIDDSLDYHVSGLHFMPDGTTPVQGSYNLVMRSETARCLYGFTSAPVKATISIVGAENSPIATVVTGEKNGWLTLSANGFTFSEKTLKVKITQDKGLAKQITCVKGKVSKVVKSATCPTGYKKK